jgi:hypothetical protein
MPTTQTLFPFPTPFTDNDGAPLNGGTLTFYQANSSTPQDTYSDQGLTVLNPNPITLNAAGFPEVSNVEVKIYPLSAAYKVVVKDSGGGVIHTWDFIEPNAPWNYTPILAFPITVTGTTHSGGVPYFSDATHLSSSNTLTQHGLLVGGGSGQPPNVLAPLTNGQLAIGNTGNDPTPATLTAGAGIQITNAAGAITIAGSVITRNVTTVTVSNSVVETTVYATTIAGGTLSTNRAIRFSMIGSWKDNAAPGGHNVIVRVKYGTATFFIAQVISSAQSANEGNLSLDFELQAHNATNTQVAKGQLFTGDGAVGNAGGFAGITIGTTGNTTVSASIASGGVDSTVDQAFAVTFQLSFADANVTASKLAAYTEVV